MFLVCVLQQMLKETRIFAQKMFEAYVYMYYFITLSLLPSGFLPCSEPLVTQTVDVCSIMLSVGIIISLCWQSGEKMLMHGKEEHLWHQSMLRN